MIQNNYFLDNSDLMLHFEEVIPWTEIITQYEGDFEDYKKFQETNDEKFSHAPSDMDSALEYYKEILTSTGSIAGKSIAQNASEMDKIGVKYENGKVIFPEIMNKIYKSYHESGLLNFMLKKESGGLGLPVTVYNMIFEIVSRADISFVMTLAANTIAETIEKYGTLELKEKWIPKFLSSEYTGSMALTEPDYGSDLINLKTKAVKQPDGTYLLTGTKRFITHGCGMSNFPAILLTLARTGEPGSGARGISFFVVDGKNVHISGIERKMGIKSSPTCEVVYENSPAEIIGEEGLGLTKYALGLMNGARLAVGTLGVGLATAAYEEAKRYSGIREQFGKPIKEIPAVQKMLDRMEREIVAMRCLNMEAAHSMDKYIWATERMKEKGISEKEIRKDETIKYWERISSLFTPIAKYYCTEMSNSIAYDAVQVHGGVGYTEEFDVARIYRDARILTIYEGTTQMQIVAAIGGIVAGMAPNAYLKKYIDSLMKSFSPSKISQKILALLEKAISLYKNLETKEKEYYAFEVVEIATKLLCGLLLEKSVEKLKDEEQKAKRRKIAFEYAKDSFSISQKNYMNLQLVNKEEVDFD
ncbi:MAG: acyl-CoA dehydrogenase family protein [Leptospiraceae bacterium]|nr:acyl-CoA dehydrogenase family protein [Leptospiraceae bacterium]